jgi:hypothetical protein
MALKAVLTGDPSLIDTTQRSFVVDGTITYSGTYPTNGDTLDLSQLNVPTNALPLEVEIIEITPAPGPAFGANFLYLPGTTQANGVMEIFNGTSQEATATYASIFGSVAVVLKFVARFPSVG